MPELKCVALTDEEVARGRRWERVLQRASSSKIDGATVAVGRSILLEERHVQEVHVATIDLRCSVSPSIGSPRQNVSNYRAGLLSAIGGLGMC
jgi:hypothetical protein